jgi:hypothetical protein
MNHRDAQAATTIVVKTVHFVKLAAGGTTGRAAGDAGPQRNKAAPKDGLVVA